MSILSSRARIAFLVVAFAFLTSAAFAQTTPGAWGVPVGVTTEYAPGHAFNTPWAVAVDSQGNIIVADGANQLVEVLLPNGAGTLTYGQAGPCGLQDVTGFPDPGPSAGTYNQSGLPSPYPSGPPPQLAYNAGCFGSPQGVAVDASDLIYVVDFANNSFLVFDSVAHTLAAGATQLKPLARFGTTAGPDWNSTGKVGTLGQFESPMAVSIDRSLARNTGATTNRVYVLDQQNNRIQGWDCNATTLLAADPVTAATGCVAKMSVGAPDPVNVVNPARGYFSFPIGFGLDQATGDIAVAESGISTVDVYRYPFTAAYPWGYAASIGSPNAVLPPDPGNIANPSDVKFDAQSNLWVTDYGNSRIQVFKQNGASAPTLLFSPLDGVGLQTSTHVDLSLIGPQTLEFDTTRNQVIIVDQGQNRLETWGQGRLDIAANLPLGLTIGSQLGSIVVTNSGSVPLDFVMPRIEQVVGVSVDFLAPTAWPPLSTQGSNHVQLAAGAATTFSVPLLVNIPGAVSFIASASATHVFSGATIASSRVTATATAAPAAAPQITSSAKLVPSTVLAGGIVCVTVTAQNGGNVTLDRPTLSITPHSATATTAQTSCPMSTLVGTASLTTTGTASQIVWTEPYIAGASGSASFDIAVSATVHNSSPVQTVSAPLVSLSTTISSDVTPPAVTISFGPQHTGGQTAPNAAGWWRTPVVAKIHATDASGLAKVCFTISPTPIDVQNTCMAVPAGDPTACGNTAGKSCDLQFLIDYSGRYNILYWAVDTATPANESAHTPATVNFDGGVPVVVFNSPTPAANAKGWNNTPMTWGIVPSDDLSGVASVTFAGAPLTTPQIALNTQEFGVQATVVITDVAGNVGTYSSPPVNLDFIKPTGTPASANGIITFPAGSTTDAAPPAVTLPAGVTVVAFQSSSVDPASLPTAGVPASAGSWTICDLAGNCTQIFFAAELVNQFDTVNKVDALYARYGTSGYVPTALIPQAKSRNTYSSHHWGSGHDNRGGSWGGKDDHRWDDDDHDDHDDCDLTTYVLKDANGNGVVMQEHIQKSSGTEVHVGVVSFSYITGCPTKCVTKAGVVPAGTTKNFEWSIDSKTGKYKTFEQEMTIGRGYSMIQISASYDAKRNQTTIRREGAGSRCFSVTLPGMVLLDMATQNGKLVIEYNGTVISQ